ncbi:hypothetical protein BGZ97_009568 [Linnemannia gamsii]|uniref:CBD9-like protein n=1 Tax=Linnemannia gamsii TaxID=64522 RepID=A0A9P6UPT1_9FUNG|nr:hypothetical protein BGZ97_009568 [Linnemannia gamsii]
MMLLSLTTGQAQQSQELCSAQMCISATIYSADTKTIEFSLFSMIPVGWLGLGIGGDPIGMAGNDLAICWPSTTGSGAIISQRSATDNGQPSVSTSAVAFQVQKNKSGLSSSNLDFTCTFSRPLNLATAPIASTATSINVIYAIGLQTASGSGDPQHTKLQKHAFTGHGVLNIQRKEGASSDANNTVTPVSGTGGSGSTNGETAQSELNKLLADERIYTLLVKVHGILMGIAFLIIFPMGAMLVRFFSHLHHVFRWHRPLQVTGFLIVIAAFTCIFVAAYKSPQGPTPVSASKHGEFGVILFAAMVLQICIGIFIFHTFDITRADRPRLRLVITTWMHRLWGYAVLIGGLVQVNLGMVLYGMWPTGREAAWYVYDAWVVILIAVFVLGSAFKWWRARKAKETANKGV